MNYVSFSVFVRATRPLNSPSRDVQLSHPLEDHSTRRGVTFIENAKKVQLRTQPSVTLSVYTATVKGARLSWIAIPC